MMNICVIGLPLSVSRKSATPVYNRRIVRVGGSREIWDGLT